MPPLNYLLFHHIVLNIKRLLVMRYNTPSTFPLSSNSYNMIHFSPGNSFLLPSKENILKKSLLSSRAKLLKEDHIKLRRLIKINDLSALMSKYSTTGLEKIF